MKAYLFVHFREKTTPAGEQVYFALSQDGFHWEAVNGGRPVLWSYYGDKGVRDHTIARNPLTNRFYILSTDLSLAYGFRNQYRSSWAEISENGSKNLSMWASDDLCNWDEQALVKVGSDEMGCVWAPDLIYDRTNADFIVHWSSSHQSDAYQKKCIYYARTADFRSFSEPSLLYEKADSGVIDSTMVEEDGIYYLFVKSEENPSTMILLKSELSTGPWAHVPAFDQAMSQIENGLYEAPTLLRTNDGHWCLFLDYYGTKGAGQGYVPFVANRLVEADFKRSDQTFSFPYGFKHGTILEIDRAEYDRVKAFDFDVDDYRSYP